MTTVVVSGTSSGLGRSLFQSLQGRHRVIGLARRILPEQQSLLSEQTSILIRDLAAPHTLDLSWDVEASEIVFIDNAAVVMAGRVDTLTFDAALEAWNVNVASPVLITQSLAHHARQAGARFRVLHITSGVAVSAVAGLALYSATKAAARRFYEAAALEGLDVALIDPGVIDTEMQQKLRDSDIPTRDYFAGLAVEGRLRDSRDVALEIIREHSL